MSKSVRGGPRGLWRVGGGEDDGVVLFWAVRVPASTYSARRSEAFQR